MTAEKKCIFILVETLLSVMTEMMLLIFIQKLFRPMQNSAKAIHSLTVIIIISTSHTQLDK